MVILSLLFQGTEIFILFGLISSFGKSGVIFTLYKKRQLDIHIFIFTGAGYSDYGLRALDALVRGDDSAYVTNPMFPRITMCSYAVSSSSTIFMMVVYHY